MASTTSTSQPGVEPGEQALQPAAPSATRSLGRTLARIARITAFAVSMAALGYGGGRLHARLQEGDVKAQLHRAAEEHTRVLERTQASHQEALTAARGAAQQAQSEQARFADLTQLYEGYRLAQHALDALDARNFGIAESELHAAGTLLAPLAPRSDGVSQVANELAETKIVVTDNLASQRDAIVARVRRLDELINAQRSSLPQSPPAAPPAPSH